MNLTTSLSTFTLVHVVISLIGIASGILMLTDIPKGKKLGAWNGMFLISTSATSLTGFMFHSASFGPPHIIGLISLCLLGLALYAAYLKNLSGHWRSAYVICAVAAFYLNVFVGVVQLFLKVPSLNAMAPTQSEPPFAIAQAIVFLVFALLGWNAVKRAQTAATH